MIDSSALVELVIKSERASAVAQAVGATDMVAPDVVNPEVLAALRRLERTGELTTQRAVEALDDLMDAPVRRFSTLPLLAEAWTLRANVSAADALYVVLARVLGCPLVTADRKLSRAPDLGVPMLTV
ncbi:MAG TPA: type II toxin-antitoxin system VapC family toxin [Actinomycetes bacterium]|nr:type II toxin-antitoxin system VapC family toxin [Actinomycetes bacterium]